MAFTEINKGDLPEERGASGLKYFFKIPPPVNPNSAFLFVQGVPG